EGARPFPVRGPQRARRGMELGFDFVGGRQRFVEGLAQRRQGPPRRGDNRQQQETAQLGPRQPLSAYPHDYVPLSPWTGPSCVTRDTKAAQTDTACQSPERSVSMIRKPYR